MEDEDQVVYASQEGAIADITPFTWEHNSPSSFIQIPFVTTVLLNPINSIFDFDEDNYMCSDGLSESQKTLSISQTNKNKESHHSLGVTQSPLSGPSLSPPASEKDVIPKVPKIHDLFKDRPKHWERQTPMKLKVNVANRTFLTPSLETTRMSTPMSNSRSQHHSTPLSTPVKSSSKPSWLGSQKKRLSLDVERRSQSPSQINNESIDIYDEPDLSSLLAHEELAPVSKRLRYSLDSSDPSQIQASLVDTTKTFCNPTNDVYSSSNAIPSSPGIESRISKSTISNSSPKSAISGGLRQALLRIKRNNEMDLSKLLSRNINKNDLSDPRNRASRWIIVDINTAQICVGNVMEVVEGIVREVHCDGLSDELSWIKAVANSSVTLLINVPNFKKICDVCIGEDSTVKSLKIFNPIELANPFHDRFPSSSFLLICTDIFELVERK